MVWGLFNIGPQEIILLLMVALAGVIAYFVFGRGTPKDQ